jgi:hypothetical protein
MDLIKSTTSGYNPQLMYCLVDKNRPQRIFIQNQDKTFGNPLSGTVVDQVIVEEQGDNIFDFFLIPHNATVATARPVLFSVCHNTSSLTKIQI